MAGSDISGPNRLLLEELDTLLYNRNSLYLARNLIDGNTPEYMTAQKPQCSWEL